MRLQLILEPFPSHGHELARITHLHLAELFHPLRQVFWCDCPPVGYLKLPCIEHQVLAVTFAPCVVVIVVRCAASVAQYAAVQLNHLDQLVDC